MESFVSLFCHVVFLFCHQAVTVSGAWQWLYTGITRRSAMWLFCFSFLIITSVDSSLDHPWWHHGRMSTLTLPSDITGGQVTCVWCHWGWVSVSPGLALLHIDPWPLAPIECSRRGTPSPFVKTERYLISVMRYGTDSCYCTVGYHLDTIVLLVLTVTIPSISRNDYASV